MSYEGWKIVSEDADGGFLIESPAGNRCHIWQGGEEIERLRAALDADANIRRYVAFVLTGREDADVQLAADETKAEVERLRAIVNKLPKTADGVPVGLLNRIYSTACGHMVEIRTLGEYYNDDITDAWDLDDHDYIEVQISECYSTREAAGAAKEKA